MPKNSDEKDYTGKSVQLKRLGKRVEVFLHKHGDGNHYKGVWLDEKGRPQTGIVPIAEIKQALGEN